MLESSAIIKGFFLNGAARDFIYEAKQAMKLFRHTFVLLSALALAAAAPAQEKKKPNIVVIMGDDVGTWNISAFHRGMMGGRTPNIDRIAKEGALFTDYYAQQSCTAGRAAFILGQTPFRTGLLKVGLPAAKQGLQDKDPTIAAPSPIGTPDKGLDEAAAKGWTVVSMKDDWKTVFPTARTH